MGDHGRSHKADTVPTESTTMRGQRGAPATPKRMVMQPGNQAGAQAALWKVVQAVWSRARMSLVGATYWAA